MRSMEICPECRPCLVRLVELSADLATSDPELNRQARQAGLEIIDREFLPGAIPAAIANRYHLAIRAISGNPDPFAGRKAAETAFLAAMHRRVASSYPEKLAALVALAAVGNAVDFFRSVEEVTEELAARATLMVSDLPGFEQILETEAPGLLLYLADNAGEQFFDRPLVEHLRRRGWRVLYVVKGGPVQNDLTRQDLYASGLGEALEPVTDTGCRTVGLDLSEVSPRFRKLFAQARLILAKGMGHFETMSHIPDPRLFFLLQAKCEPVARALGVSRRAFVFRWAGNPA